MPLAFKIIFVNFVGCNDIFIATTDYKTIVHNEQYFGTAHNKSSFQYS